MTAETTVDSLITNAQTYAGEAIDEAQSLIAEAQTASQGYSTVDPGQFDFSVPSNLTVNIPDLPESGSAVIGEYAVPDFDAPLPEFLVTNGVSQLNLPDKPDEISLSGLFNHAEPSQNIENYNTSCPELDLDTPYPDAPTITQYTAPELAEINIGERPDVTPARFESTLTLDGVVPDDPDDLSSVFQERYDTMLNPMKVFLDGKVSEWMDKYSPGFNKIRDKLEQSICDGMEGNTAMPDAVEEQLFNRARERTQAEADALINQSYEQSARTGYTIPSGMNMRAVYRARMDAAKVNASSASEIAVKRYEVELNHLQFMVQVGESMRVSMLTLAIQSADQFIRINQQVIDFADKFVGHMRENYNLLLRRAEILLSLHDTQARLYESELKSSLVDIELYTLEIQAEREKSDLNKSRVDTFNALIDQEKIKTDIYATQVRAINEQAQRERIKIEKFKAKLDSFDLKNRIKSLEVEIFNGLNQGDLAKVNARRAEIESYRAEVEAAESVVKAEAEAQRNALDHNDNLIRRYQLQLDKFKVEVDAETSRVDRLTQIHDSDIRTFQSVLQANIQQFTSDIELIKISLEAEKQTFDSKLQSGVANAELFMKHIDLLSQTSVAAARVEAAIAQSALSSQGTMVSLVNQTNQTA